METEAKIAAAQLLEQFQKQHAKEVESNIKGRIIERIKNSKAEDDIKAWSIRQVEDDFEVLPQTLGQS